MFRAVPTHAEVSIIKSKGLSRVFQGSVALILALTAAAKVLSILAGNWDTNAFDPLLSPIRQVWLVAGAAGLEVAILCVMLISRDESLRLCAIFWLASMFAMYRVGLAAIGYAGNCNCLGIPQSWWFTVHRQAGDNAMMLVLLYMLAGSACLLFFRQRRSAGRT